jgi:hypothetical protein
LNDEETTPKEKAQFPLYFLPAMLFTPSNFEKKIVL